MIGFSLSDIMGGDPLEPDDLQLQTDDALRRRVLKVCDDSDRPAVQIAAGSILDGLAEKYGIVRAFD